MSRARSRRLLSLVCLAFACGPAKSDSATDAATSDGPTTGTADPGGTTGAAACVPGPQVGDLECVPRGASLSSWDFFVLEGVLQDSYAAQCDVAAVTDDGEEQTIALTCGADEPTLRLWTVAPHVPLALDVGAAVTIDFVTVPDGEVQRASFTLLDEADALLAAGVDLAVLPAALGPLTVDLRSTDCEGDLFNECIVVQRAGVEVTLGDASVVVFDGNVGALPGFEVLVGASTREVCFDEGAPVCGFNYSPTSTEALILASPG